MILTALEDLSEEKVAEIAAVSDTVFGRRVFLDVLGLLPTPVELEAFKGDRRSDKRTRLVGDLLADR